MIDINTPNVIKTKHLDKLQMRKNRNGKYLELIKNRLSQKVPEDNFNPIHIRDYSPTSFCTASSNDSFW